LHTLYVRSCLVTFWWPQGLVDESKKLLICDPRVILVKQIYRSRKFDKITWKYVWPRCLYRNWTQNDEYWSSAGFDSFVKPVINYSGYYISALYNRIYSNFVWLCNFTLQHIICERRQIILTKYCLIISE